MAQIRVQSDAPGLSYWQNRVRQYPELAEPKVMLSWHYFQQAKTSGQHGPLQQSYRQLMDALELQPSRNAIKLAVHLTNYQHDFELSEQLAQYYLSHWPYDSQVYLWRLQGAIAQKQGKLVRTLAVSLAGLPEDLYTLLAQADLAADQKDFDSRRNWLKQALQRANDRRTKAWIWLQLAVIHLDWQKDLALADRELNCAEELDPNNPDIWRHRIEWLALNQQYAQAAAKLKQLQRWHQHPELTPLSTMINQQSKTAEHTEPVARVCTQALQQFLVRKCVEGHP